MSCNAPYDLSKDLCFVFMTMETPLLRDATELPDAAALLADIWNKDQLILRRRGHVIFETCERMENSPNKATQLRNMELDVA